MPKAGVASTAVKPSCAHQLSFRRGVAATPRAAAPSSLTLGRVKRALCALLPPREDGNTPRN